MNHVQSVRWLRESDRSNLTEFQSLNNLVWLFPIRNWMAYSSYQAQHEGRDFLEAIVCMCAHICVFQLIKIV